MTTGTELATAYVTLTVTTRGMERDIRRQFSAVERDAGSTGRAAGKAMGGGIVAAAKSFAGPLVAAFGVGAVVSQISDAVTAGSDFQQAIGGADAVFKKDSDGIKKSAGNAAKALALPRTAYLELATVLGAGLKNKGLDDVAGQTQKLIGLGADLAAQYGGDTKSAVEAISSLMRGEADPIERYGIGINETAVNAKLAEKGLKGLKGAALEQAKAQARVDLLFEQAKDAMGAASREAGTYAGVNGRLSATWADMKTDIGSALLPALTDLSAWFLRDGLPAAKEFGGWLKDELWPALKEGYQTVMPGLQQAMEIVSEAFGSSGTGDPLRDFGTLLVDKIIPAVSTFANVALPAMATQLAFVVEAVRKVGAFFDLQVEVARKFFTAMTNGFIGVTNTAADMLEALSVVPGFGWAADAAEKLRGIVSEAEAVKDAINGIPRSRRIEIIAQVSMPGRITVGGQSINIGMREHGGPVQKGQPYIVGEKRPELFVPNQSGKILPRVPEPAAAGVGDGAGLDYYRLAKTLVWTLRDEGAFKVDVATASHEIARYRNSRTW